MAEIGVRDGVLHISLSVPERMLSLHGRDIAVPIATITGVAGVPDVLAEVRGLKLPGAGIPGVLAIGTWRGSDDSRTFHDFVLVHHGGAGVVVSIEGGDYDRILLGSDDPAALIAAIRA